MELKEGMYVRTNHHHEHVVRKIMHIYEDPKEHDHCLVFDKPTKYTYYVEDNNFIAKENPIDLIEKGDIILYDDLRMPFSLEIIRDIHNSVMLQRIKNGEIKIKRILTKEQFEQMSYKVEV